MAEGAIPSQTVTPATKGEKTPHKRICKVRAKTNVTSKSSQKQNALQEDKLKNMLATADEIASPEHFTYWKDEFLATFQQFLDPDGTATAREADDHMYFQMQRLVKVLVNVKELCGDGQISEDRITVKGRNSLNEMIAEMASLEKDIKRYWPKTQEDEQLVGYTKFELGAILVRDGFRVFAVMVTTKDYAISLRDGPLKGDKFLTPNSRSIMEFYLKEIDSFCDTMADLGMYKLMKRMVDMYKIRPRKKKKKRFDRRKQGALSDSSDDETSGSSKRMFRRAKTEFRSIMDKGWTNGVNGREVHDISKDVEGETGETNTESRSKENNNDESEDTEFIYYFDPVTEKIGKVSRRKCMAENLIIKRNEAGNEFQDGAVEEWEGEEGKSMLIWKFKKALKGQSLKKDESHQQHARKAKKASKKQ